MALFARLLAPRTRRLGGMAFPRAPDGRGAGLFRVAFAPHANGWVPRGRLGAPGEKPGELMGRTGGGESEDLELTTYNLRRLFVLCKFPGHVLSKAIHGVGQAQLTPEVFRVQMAGGDAQSMSFVVGDDDSFCQRIQMIGMA